VTSLSFGQVKSSRSEEAAPPFDALAAWFRAHASIDLTSRTVSTYEELVTSVRDGSSDVAWLPPVVYAWLAEGVTPLGRIVREGKTTYSAALVVREDSPVKELADLKRLRAGWVDPWSAAGFVVPRLELARKGIGLGRAFRSETFHGSHREALLALQRDECDVVGTYARTPADGEEQATEGGWSEIEGLAVRVLATFGAIPPDVVAVRRNLGPEEHELMIEAFRRVGTDEEGKKLLRAVFGGEELREGIEPGHAVLRRSYELGLAKGLFDRD
jgi:phosphate/phosphite/phosphonate ABC transporter binding protein